MPKSKAANEGVARYVVEPVPDIDLAVEDIRDRKGNRVTQEYVDQAVADVHAHIERRAAGRPALGAPGRESPTLGVRLPDALKAAVEARAKREGRRPAALVREAIEQYLKR